MSEEKGKFYRDLEDVPEQVKELFRHVETSESIENWDSDLDKEGCWALRNCDGESEHRWMRLGIYDPKSDDILVEYFLNYNFEEWKMGAQHELTSRSPDYLQDRGSEIIEIPRKMYEDAKESLNRELS
ncbi:MAG: hypothetical protein ABEK04_06220 [Candidatus Nanohalobium sp.]